MASRNFKSCSFGPAALRELVRQELEDGERVTGWGFATRAPGSSLATLNLLSAMVPWLMIFTMPLITRETRRFLILTDRRLLLLRTDRRQPGRQSGDLMREFALHDVVVRAGKDDRSFEVLGWDGAALEKLKIPKQPGRPAGRMVEGLGVLAGEDPAMLLDVRRSINARPGIG